MSDLFETGSLRQSLPAVKRYVEDSLDPLYDVGLSREEWCFIQSIRDAPEDGTIRLMFADYLEDEQGLLDAAEWLRDHFPD